MFDEKMWFCYNLPGRMATYLTKTCGFGIICPVEGHMFDERCDSAIICPVEGSHV